jgi:hypothetical protein
MHQLFHALAGVVLASALISAQKPSGPDAAALIEKSRQRSLAYANSLPDFVCTEVISRYKLTTRTPGGRSTITNGIPEWSPLDKLTVNLSYFQQHERHELRLWNGKPTRQTFDSLDTGVTSTGEFGGILRSVFDPRSQTSFRWESWKNVRGRSVGVYVYQVEEIHSSYFVKASTRGDSRRAIVGFHGTLEIDRETGEVVRLVHVADRIPLQLDMSRAATEVDYDVIEVAGNRYLLPVHSETTLDRKSGASKNESEFRDYRKFEVGSKVDYDVDK